MRKEQFEKGEFFHIYNRGVDKRIIFSDNRERLRFVHGLYLFNNFLDIPNIFDVLTLTPREILTPIEPYVEIVAGCLMPTHYHLMLTQKRENGISRFLQKIGLSHTNYFNKRHERTGRLFESTFKAKHVDRDEYASYLTQYIHLNPADLYRSKIGHDEMLKKVEEYQWSSLPIYLGKKSPFSLVVSTNFRDKILDMNALEYLEFFRETSCDD